MTEQAGLVSVVVIFLNEERFLDEAIASVYAQTYPHWELLLVDDGSTDGSTQIAMRYAARDSTRVQYLEHAGHQNRGMSASRNLGIASGRGEFVAFLDGDDVWMPRRLERAVALLRVYPDAHMIYGKAQYWYSWTGSSVAARDRIQPHGFPANRVIRPPDLLVRYLTDRAALPPPGSVTVRREALVQAGGFEDSFRNLYEDQAFLARFCLRHTVYVSDECLDRYRQHAESACAVAEVRGAHTLARSVYMAWLESYLDGQGFRDTDVWAALQFARKADDRRAAQWRSRLRRFVRRAAGIVDQATRSARDVARRSETAGGKDGGDFTGPGGK